MKTQKIIFLLCALIFIFCRSGCIQDASSKLNSSPAYSGSEAGKSAILDENIPAGGNSSFSANDMAAAPNEKQAENDIMPNVNIKIGSTNFTLILYDNASSRAFLEKLPITLDMAELNGNEKYHFFSEDFPTAAQQSENIHEGELMLYGSSCLVLFYEAFQSSYKYTKLGYIENTSGLANALGEKSIEVAFSISAA